MTFRIRWARAEDLPEILRIERMSFDHPWNDEHFLKELEKPGSMFLVLEIEGRVRGYGCFWLIAGELQVANLAVDPEFRGRGFGRALLETGLRLGRIRGARRATLEVREGNLPARRLYESLGFRLEGRRRGYYPFTDEEALLMGLSLTRRRENLP
ncbi:ribosomal protein S18-alanine N-acetyltransferase [Thermosulfurimonas sp. F29]|uniref:ribosomal protein S18-alanine N-acetyltransferase n=1 Tax=Thermosulfurimonas sp. F29 TaxID=2867247 RepID=UPI001C835E0E|nr:ribosomal protein S18-alanine N-acetyltransferase [Thermosulfurimonas sp. F29]MBX6423134.1 ribosomal protein S18-alanine N-acetyltransferase [Thermosulfurimonas sp. F29]